jgi:thiol-disulfide isomerase/thioredoxin
LISRPLALTFAGFAALGALVLGAYLHERLQPAEPLRTEPAIAPVAAPAAAPSGGGAAIPTQRPLFALADPDGKTHSISEWDGKALVVNFWATWCAPCRREIPLLNRIQKEFGAKSVEVVGIAVDVAADVKAYQGQFPIEYPVLVGDQDAIDAARDFGVDAQAYPFTVFTDTKGRIITIHLGELHEPLLRAILGVIEREDAGKLTADEARDAIRTATSSLEPATPG